MPGNSQRRGATRRPGSKKGSTVGTGGQSRKSLQGRGPTPPAADRSYHPAAKRQRAADRAERANTSDGSTPRRSGGPAGTKRKTSGTNEYVAGRNAVVEALAGGVPAKTLFVAMRIESDDRVRAAMNLAMEAGVPLMEGTKQDLDRMSGNAVHQGLVLQIPPYEYAHPSDLLSLAKEARQPALIVALDGVTDPRNLGAVVRSAAAFGGHGVIVPERRAAGMTASAWKTSAGAAARVKVARATNLTRTLNDLKQAGCFVVGLDAGGDVQLPGLELATSPLVLVAGSEGKGLSRLVRETCDAIASIPMAAGNESLNAGVAAGIALYEVARQRA